MASGVEISVEDGVGTITLARPERLNAFDEETIASLAAASTKLAHDDTARVILVTGSGRGFCAGLDLRFATQQAMSGADIPDLVRRVTTHLHGTVSELRRAPKPVVTAINGPAAGAGVGLALAGDVVLASSAATFTLSYTRIGLAPDGGTTYFVTRLVGEKRALDLFMSAESVSADDALRLGLVSRVLPSERFLDEARAVARKLAAGPTRAFALAKGLVLDSLREGLETQMEKERRAIATTFGTEDFMEGVQAFFEKRPAAFKGK
jgi:2-(1,2-epoxy-1,2-dihydrophenyl)acetyl-CoA isomerase